MLQIITFLNCFFKFGLHVVNLEEQTEVSFTSLHSSWSLGLTSPLFIQLPLYNLDKPN